MDKKKLIVGGAVGVVVVFLGWMVLHRPPENSVDHPDGFHYVCRNPSCKNEFILTSAEFDDWVIHHPGQTIKCPKCGTDDAQRVGTKSRPAPDARNR
jgi:hypothetical protein